MSSHKLTREDWKVAMTKLRDRHKSILVYGLLRRLQEDKWSGYDVWTDSWPDFKSIIAKPIGTEKLDPYTGKFYLVDSDDVDSMTSLLDDKRIITWEEDINICVSETVWSLLEERGRERGSFKFDAQAPIYTLSRDSFNQVPAPDGYTFEKMTRDVIPHVTKNWAHAVPGLDQYMEVLLARDYPTVCLRDPSGKMAAYAATQFHNLLGMLHVVPEFRGQGLGTAAMSALVEKTLQEVDVVGVLVQDTNPVSVHMHTKLGFKPSDNGVQCWVLYTAGTSGCGE